MVTLCSMEHRAYTCMELSVSTFLLDILGIEEMLLLLGSDFNACKWGVFGMTISIKVPFRVFLYTNTMHV